MQIKHCNNKSAQATLAYVIFILIVIAAFSAMTWMLRHKLQASYKDSADAFGEGRQFGSLSTSGGVAPFVFPVLPRGSPVVVPPVTPPNPDCDLAQLNALQQDSVNKSQALTAATQVSATARQEAADAHKEAEAAKEAARIAREEAVQARQDADNARAVANSARWQCYDCRYGENSGGDCTSICDEADRLETEATNKENIATNKENIATNKENIAADKQRIAVDKDAIAAQKEQITMQAAQDAQAAADALQAANDACYNQTPPPA